MAGESMLRLAGNIDRSGWLGSVGLGSKPTEDLELFVDGFAGSEWGQEVNWGATAGLKFRW